MERLIEIAKGEAPDLPEAPPVAETASEAITETATEASAEAAADEENKA